MKKKLLYILVAILPMAAFAAHPWASQSVMSSGKFIKVRIAETGVYKLTYTELASMGLTPENVRVLGYGGAMLSQDFSQPIIDDLPSIPFYMNKGADGVFNAGDYILFYAQGSFSWSYQSGHFVHTRNPYSDFGYYFLSDNAGTQLLIDEADALAPATYVASSYQAMAIHDVDKLNVVNPSGKSGGGRHFYGEELNATSPNLVVTLPFSHVLSGSSLDVRCRVGAYSSQPTTISMKMGAITHSTTLKAVPVSDFYTRATTNAKNDKNAENDRYEFTAVGQGNQSLTLSFANSASGAKAWLDFVEVTATCYLQFNGVSMPIVNIDHLGEAATTSYTLQNATATTEIWDITDPTSISRIPATHSGNTLTWTGRNESIQYVLAIDPTANSFYTPTVIGEVPNQNLHRLATIDFVVITPEEFLEAAQRIASAHENYDGLTTAVVTDQQVYNEFSSGTPDATAYRRLMKMLYDKAGSNVRRRPSSLLLMGDGTFDNRKLLATSGPACLLTYQADNSEVETDAYATDDYFGFLDDSEGLSDILGRMDIGVGRIPCATVAEANGVATKIESYLRNETQGAWQQQLMFVADDGDSNLHTQITDLAAERTRQRNPAFVVNKVYLDAYQQESNAAGESYPVAKNRFLNLINNGVLFFDYSGHGGYNNIASEQLLTLRDCKTLTNRNQGFWMLATCGFAHFDGYDRSASEEAVLNPDGGAIAVLSACRTVYASQNRVINRNLCDTLFGHTSDFNYPMTIGNATRIAKNMTGSDMNKMSYILLGDPAIRLHYPTDYRVRTCQVSDTLNALTTHTFAGWIENEQGDTATEFEGTVYISMLDKLQQITTLDNDEPDATKKVAYTYNDYPNTLYQGVASVQNGKFDYTFIVPKDIRYNYGRGRMTYFALDSLNGAGIGHYENFVIGGSSAVEIIDTIGPEMTIWLNNPAFVSGDQTNETPHFYASLYDEHGINTVGSGIGHDLLLAIDNNPLLMMVLNDYYTSSGSYQSGVVSYQIPALADGQHTLSFRAWDMLNNSTTKSLSFYVVTGLDPTVYSVMTYPNPARVSEKINVVVEYNQPDALVDMHMYVYTPEGQLVYTLQRRGTDQHTFAIENATLKAGIYVYRVALTTGNGTTVSKAGKLIVTE